MNQQASPILTYQLELCIDDFYSKLDPLLAMEIKDYRFMKNCFKNVDEFIKSGLDYDECLIEFQQLNEQLTMLANKMEGSIKVED